MEYSTGQRFNLSNVLFLVLLWITSGAFAGPLEDAATAFKHGDYSTAMALWRPLAEEGNAAAQTGMGILYENGREVVKSEAQAVAWYQKAAAQGDAEAEYRLGQRYVQGPLSTSSFPRDVPRGLTLMKKAADQGHVRSMEAIAEYYRNGLFGVRKDAVEATAWHRRAAELGYALAEERLGNAYEFGQGVDQDSALAEEWYQRSTKHYLKDAEEGDVSAQLAVGMGYELGGMGFKRDKAAALFWYRSAARQKGPLRGTAEAAVARVEKAREIPH
ncbi:tetratricopeptide repeat protein [Ralstonia insidiosa]|jgi:TPR repeat protein|uniref:tetratricopeptide repeat protein n=1 Tax=Ralstonia TaxID=48736 RepID=UPI000664988D|nr:tetratricopeptide repeat protein [Ralstonia insidiosa]MBX3775520.1 sel1 repeat family protein [Ralstonia pickettii]MBA9859633.1 sel1 repeat family protein [Ralstonia insidiosa]MBA9873254.1 sel1 repeat family protein [Ralstonia insidiosa]MBA9916211.1 sel1 repeat family protein [Ralstonia insidiosa]MBA9940198.1 sel1 repeat family protein [Ralstonia insidiosa]